MKDKHVSSVYFENLFSLKKKMLNKDYLEQDKIWIDEYNKRVKIGYITENLPFLLSLIHPDFYYRKGECFITNLDWIPHSNFSRDIIKSDLCQSEKISGDSCIFNEIQEIRGKCHADHKWPNSLGGPSIMGNRYILCKYHNGMKSNDIYNFTWALIPEWLEDYLERIYRLKN